MHYGTRIMHFVDGPTPITYCPGETRATLGKKSALKNMRVWYINWHAHSMEKIHLQVSSEQEGLEALIMFGKSDSPRHGTGPSSVGSWDAHLFYPWKNRFSILRGCS